ncbi:MAG: hypothetical protein WC867_04505 [Candidatus Pacearchaeota archaeon]|jgi:2'-5' RNA ligase
MDFSIVYLFKGNLNKEIERLKRDISSFGPKVALEWPSTIELRKGFDIPEEKLKEITSRFKGFIKNIKSFQITLKDFEFIEETSLDKKDCIKNNYFILIKINNSVELNSLKNKLNEFRIDINEDNEDFNPNIKLAFDDLTESSFKKIKSHLKRKKFNNNLYIDNISLLLNKNDKHIIYKSFNLS